MNWGKLKNWLGRTILWFKNDELSLVDFNWSLCSEISWDEIKEVWNSRFRWFFCRNNSNRGYIYDYKTSLKLLLSFYLNPFTFPGEIIWMLIFCTSFCPLSPSQGKIQENSYPHEICRWIKIWNSFQSILHLWYRISIGR